MNRNCHTTASYINRKVKFQKHIQIDRLPISVITHNDYYQVKRLERNVPVVAMADTCNCYLMNLANRR